VPSARTRIEPNFDPGMAGQLKSATGHDITVGGADLVGQVIKAGLVDELQLFLVPVIVGGGKRALPNCVRSESVSPGTTPPDPHWAPIAAGRRAVIQRATSLSASHCRAHDQPGCMSMQRAPRTKRPVMVDM